MTKTSAFLDKQKLLLAKIESTYGTDPTPAFNANEVEAFDISINYPFEVLERNLNREDISQTAPISGKQLVEISFTCEVKGSGTRGTAGRLSPLLKACNFTEALTGSTSAVYATASTPYSCTIYFYEVNATTSGNYKLHKITGCKGDVSFENVAGQIPIAKFNFKGLFNKPSDVSDPGNPTYETTDPNVVSNATFTFDSDTSMIIESMTINVGNEISERPSVNNVRGVHSYIITGRKPTMNINPEVVLESELDFWGNLSGSSSVAASLFISGATGNQVLFEMPVVTIDSIAAGNRNGMSIMDIPCHLGASSGNDEITITIT